MFLVLVAAVPAVGGAQAVPAPAEPREWLLALLGVLLGLRVIAYVPSNPVGWLFLVVGGFAAVSVFTATWPQNAAAAWFRAWSWWPTYALLPVIALLFPEGRAPGRWRRALVAIILAATFAVVGSLASLAWSDPRGYLATSPDRGVPDPPPAILIFIAAGAVVVTGGLVAAVVLIARARHATGGQRRTLVWAGSATLLLLFADLLELLGFSLVWIVGALAFPLAAVAAVVRHGLYDIDLLLHRSLLYGVLTVAALVVYVSSVTVLTGFAPEQAAPVAAAAAALAMHPMHKQAQRRVDHFVYGDRGAPAVVMSRLGEQLTGPLALNEVLSAVAGAIGSALKVPHVCVDLGDPELPKGEYGQPRGRPVVELPLLYRGESTGQLVVETRSPEERFTRQERQALTDLARQAGAAVGAVRLAIDLQRARERLVTAREEERRRLRRDLHDGVGPVLAGTIMQMGAARALLGSKDTVEQAASLLVGLEHELQSCVGEVRRVVYGLRPPALDELGLPAAVRTQTRQLTAASDLTVTAQFEQGQLDGLPAAVEVAAYRIAVEAVNNTVRHARARRCWVRLHRQQDWFIVEVTDDGIGVPSPLPAGVGVAGMRERAAELGGKCTVNKRSGGGTQVHAHLPLSVHRTDVTSPPEARL